MLLWLPEYRQSSAFLGPPEEGRRDSQKVKGLSCGFGESNCGAPLSKRTCKAGHPIAGALVCKRPVEEGKAGQMVGGKEIGERDQRQFVTCVRILVRLRG